MERIKKIGRMKKGIELAFILEKLKKPRKRLDFQFIDTLLGMYEE